MIIQDTITLTQTQAHSLKGACLRVINSAKYTVGVNKNGWLKKTAQTIINLIDENTNPKNGEEITIFYTGDFSPICRLLEDSNELLEQAHALGHFSIAPMDSYFYQAYAENMALQEQIYAIIKKHETLIQERWGN